MATKSRSSTIVVRLTLPDPFRFVNRLRLKIHKDDEAKHVYLITDGLEIKCRRVLNRDETVIDMKLARSRARRMGVLGGLRAWWRLSEDYGSLPFNIRNALFGKSLYFFGTVMIGRGGKFYVPVLDCHGCCVRRFELLDYGFGSRSCVALIRGLPPARAGGAKASLPRRRAGK